jgi:hypothetical protein
MAKTLFDLTLELARILGTVREGVATGGSTTTIVDTVARTEDDDAFNGGTAWITYDAGGAGAAPQGEYQIVSDFTASSDTITTAAFSAAIASGDRYAVAGLRYPLDLLIQKINESFGVIEKTDTSTVVFAAEQTEYSLPTDVLELKQVFIAAETDDSNDNRWQPIYDWYTQKSATGTADKIIFAHQYATDTDVKIVYTTYHSVLRVATDKLDDSIHWKRILYNAAVAAVLWRQMKVGQSDDLSRELNYFQGIAASMNNEFAQRLPRRGAKTISPVLNRP